MSRAIARGKAVRMAGRRVDPGGVLIRVSRRAPSVVLETAPIDPSRASQATHVPSISPVQSPRRPPQTSEKPRERTCTRCSPTSLDHRIRLSNARFTASKSTSR